MIITALASMLWAEYEIKLGVSGRAGPGPRFPRTTFWPCWPTSGNERAVCGVRSERSRTWPRSATFVPACPTAATLRPMTTMTSSWLTIDLLISTLFKLFMSMIIWWIKISLWNCAQWVMMSGILQMPIFEFYSLFPSTWPSWSISIQHC